MAPAYAHQRTVLVMGIQILYHMCQKLRQTDIAPVGLIASDLYVERR